MSKLTHERLLEVMHYDPATGVFTWLVDRYRKVKAGDPAGCLSHGYWQLCIDGELHLGHRLAVFYMTGLWPSKQVDHEDRNRANNKWLNLRPATNAQNAQNVDLRSHNTSGRTGVSWREDKQKWRARVHVNGVEQNLGLHETFADAAAARRRGEQEFFTHCKGSEHAAMVD